MTMTLETNIRRVEDSFGRPVEFKSAWRFSGHRSRSNAEKDDLARNSLSREGEEYVNRILQEGVQGIVFDHVQLIANEDGGSDTTKSWDGKRSHSCWGTAVGYVFVKLAD